MSSGGQNPQGGGANAPGQYAPDLSKFNFGFLKLLSTQRVTKDGQPAKRRGPKPDSKPALTRRQELNRQAQRTHRERKEQYIRMLEFEVSRLREVYTADITEKNRELDQQRGYIASLQDENALLRSILQDHGIPFEAELERRRFERQLGPVPAAPPSQTTGSTTGSQSAGFHGSTMGFSASPSSTFTPPTPLSNPPPPGPAPGQQQQFHSPSPTSPYAQNVPSHTDDRNEISPLPGIFEEDPHLQVDFILALEEPCRDHTEMLARWSVEDVEKQSFFSGHALMASCPPPSHLNNQPPTNQYPHQTYDLPTANLEKLLNLSRQLITDGQVTPIMALQSLKNHELYHTLTREDIKTIIDTLHAKVRCYGFGAVIEDFELRDCLESVLSSKLDRTRGVPVPSAAQHHVGDDALFA